MSLGHQCILPVLFTASFPSIPEIFLTPHRGRPAGLKSQHVTAVRWLADATGAEVDGLEVGSHTLEFRPRDPPTALRRNLGDGKISIVAGSGAASAMLIFQPLGVGQ